MCKFTVILRRYLQSINVAGKQSVKKAEDATLDLKKKISLI